MKRKGKGPGPGWPLATSGAPNSVAGPVETVPLTGNSGREEFKAGGGTSATPLDEDPQYASSTPQLADKYLQGKARISSDTTALILVLLWLGLLSWIFQQDNGMGKLDSPEGIRSFIWKSALYTSYVILAGALLALTRRLLRPPVGEG